MENKQIENAKRRYKQIENLVKKDSVAGSFLRKLVESATRYVSFTANMQADINRLKTSDSYFKEKETIANLDRTRRNYHEGLLSNLNIFNRYLFKNYNGKTPIGGIYSLSPESIRDRNAVGDWAGCLVFGLKK